MGDTPAILHGALEEIGRRAGEVERVSSFYRTAPWGFQAERDFLNAAAVVESGLSPEQMLDTLMDIERVFGRTRPVQGSGYASRTLDIDIIFAADRVIDSERLRIPHPLAHRRRFVLEPLCEIAPQMQHPTLGKTVAQLLRECPDA